MEPITKQVKNDLLYLMACGLHERPANAARVAAMDLPAVLALATWHSVSALAAKPLLQLWQTQPAQASIMKPWHTAEARAQMRYIQFAAERETVCNWMEQAGIWHMPLKGSILQDYYPQPYLREMTDVDILFDQSRRSELRTFMESCGYCFNTFEHHDIYTKPPYYNFEMHLGLVDRDASQTWMEYYRNVRDRLVPALGCMYDLRFTDEDYYIYMVVHAGKHMFSGGVGIRVLADFFVLERALGSTLNWSKINADLKQLGLFDYAIASRQLAQNVFADPETEETNLELDMQSKDNKVLSSSEVSAQQTALSSEEQKLLTAYLESGTHGTKATALKNALGALEAELGSRRQAKYGYILQRLFPPFENMSRYNKRLAKHPWMLPYYWLKRIVCAVADGKLSELDAIRKI